MGANAQTTVPTFVTSQVLTAAQVNQINTGVPTFATTVTRDAAFGGSGEKTLAQGQLCYLESTNKVQYYDGSAWANLGSMTNVTAFTASGTFTPPTGVTYAIAHITGGGGGCGRATAGAGGNSSVAFAGGTITATGGSAVNGSVGTASHVNAAAGVANSGAGATGSVAREVIVSGGTALSEMQVWNARPGASIVAGGAVTAGVGITVTVGAGGTAGTNGAAGGSGYVWIEYQV